MGIRICGFLVTNASIDIFLLCVVHLLLATPAISVEFQREKYALGLKSKGNSRTYVSIQNSH